MRNINQFPLQRLPMSKKTQDWKEACVDYIAGHSQGSSRDGNNRSRKEEMQTYYDLYNSIYSEKILSMLLIHSNNRMDFQLWLKTII